MRRFTVCTLHQFRVIKPRRIRWNGNVVCNINEMRNAYGIIVQKPEGMISFWRHKHK
jgi:hypothetical protein